jgi:hypothetical protein
MNSEEPKADRNDDLGVPGGDTFKNRSAIRNFSLYEDPRRAGQEETHSRGEQICHNFHGRPDTRRKKPAQCIDVDVTVLARRNRGSEKAEPQQKMSQEDVSPENPG